MFRKRSDVLPDGLESWTYGFAPVDPPRISKGDYKDLREGRMIVVTILEKSEGACFICGKREKTVTVKLKEPKFTGTICMEHLYERIPEAKKEEGTEA